MGKKVPVLGLGPKLLLFAVLFDLFDAEKNLPAHAYGGQKTDQKAILLFHKKPFVNAEASSTYAKEGAPGMYDAAMAEEERNTLFCRSHDKFQRVSEIFLTSVNTSRLHNQQHRQ